MTVMLKDVLPVDLLLKHIEDGVVRKQVHPDYPDQLYILNYSEKAQFDRIWDAVTNVCRGLIVAITPEGDAVLARGYNKFHNLNTTYVPETMEENLPNETPLATEKLDGSMGLPYYWDGQYWVATRGSFASDQAKWATAWLRKHFDDKFRYFGSPLDNFIGTTLVCEVIYAENRIVVNYDYEGLVATGLIDLVTGRELDRGTLESVAVQAGIPVVKRFDKTLAEMTAENNLNEEGYVLTYSNGVKVKVKFEDYKRLHRVLTGLNPKSIWEMLEAGQTEGINAILNDKTMPVPFVLWFRGWVEQLCLRFAEIEKRAMRVFVDRPKPDSDFGPALERKRAALYFQKTPELCSILFAMLDGKDYHSIIWDRLRPKATDTFKKDGE